MKTYSRKNSSYLKKAFVGSNFNEMCRLCLSEVDMVLTPIFQDYKISYQEWIQYSVDVSIEEDDGLPTNICEECLGMVEQTYLFKKKCKASDSKLREHLELLEQNEESKMSDVGFDEESEDHINVIKIEENNSNPVEVKCDESSTVDSGGTKEIPQEECKQQLEKETGIEVIENETQNNESQIVLEDKKVDNDVIEEEKDKVEEKEEEEEEGEEEEDDDDEDEELQSQGKNIKVQRYILKGEKRDGEQEEDLTVCEVVPLDVRQEDETMCSDTQNSLDCNEQNGTVEKLPPGGRIQEIYQLWENDEENEEPVSEEAEKDEDNVMIVDLVLQDGEGENDNAMQDRPVLSGNQIKIIATVPQSLRFKCNNCTDAFATSTELRRHLGKVHKDYSDMAFCDICCKSFTCVNSLKRHMSVHTGFKPFKCKICGRDFSQGSILKRHILTHESLKPFNCHYCDKSYTQKTNLLSHLKTHGFKTGADSYRCKLCNKSFVHQSGLSRHSKQHKGVSYLCKVCSKSFNDSSTLGRHLRMIHQVK